MLKKKIGIIGAGRLGSALVRALKATSCEFVGISCLTYAESIKIAKILEVQACADNLELVQKSDVVFFTVPDKQIVSTVEACVQNYQTEKYFFHCSGAMSANILPISKNIWRGSFHPLQSFASGKEEFSDISIALDGDDKAVEVAKQLCEILQAKPLSIPSEDRALYHAAACIASNHLVTLLCIVQDIFSRWTKTPEEAQQAFLPLVKGSFNNWHKMSEKALTGPVARGDIQTVEKHLAILPKELLEFYQVMSLYTLELAKKNNNLSLLEINEMEKTLQTREKDNGET